MLRMNQDQLNCMANCYEDMAEALAARMRDEASGPFAMHREAFDVRCFQLMSISNSMLPEMVEMRFEEDSALPESLGAAARTLARDMRRAQSPTLLLGLADAAIDLATALHLCDQQGLWASLARVGMQPLRRAV